MSMELLTNPEKAIKHAKKKKDIHYTTKVLAVKSFLISVAMLFLVFKDSYASATPLMVLSLGMSTFFFVILMAIIFSWAIQLIANTLGGKGKYFEALTSITYALAAPSLGILLASLLTIVPQSWPVSFIILVPAFALGIATLYRSIRELFKIDMVTTFVTVSITITSFLLAAYTLVTLNLLSTASLL
jgi:hypothetical protein